LLDELAELNRRGPKTESAFGLDWVVLSCDSTAQLLVWGLSPDDLVDALKRRAAKHGRSAEAEHRIILEETLLPQDTGFWDRAEKLRDELRGRISGDSADLIREDRNER